MKRKIRFYESIEDVFKGIAFLVVIIGMAGVAGGIDQETISIPRGILMFIVIAAFAGCCIMVSSFVKVKRVRLRKKWIREKSSSD